MTEAAMRVLQPNSLYLLAALLEDRNWLDSDVTNAVYKVYNEYHIGMSLMRERLSRTQDDLIQRNKEMLKLLEKGSKNV